MSFLTPALTAGALLIALPIILHLVMRREPVPLVFPALRFVQKRRSTNQTRMKLRHWLLLALRCAAIALLAFALSRPTLRGSGLQGGTTGQVAVAVVMDNSPRMLYRVNNQTRLDAAKDLAGWLLEQLPADSRVAVLERGSARGKRMLDRDAGQLRASRTKISYRRRALESAVRDAVDVLAERADDRRELYLVTDMAATAWSDATRQAIARELDRIEGLTLYLVDVGAERAVNRGLGKIELSSSLLASGQPLTIQAAVTRSQEATTDSLVAELWIRRNGKPEKRGETIIAPDASSAEFTVASLKEGVQQGYVRLNAADSLEADNTRYFTVDVQPARSLLLVERSKQGALFVDQALAPADEATGEAAVYKTERVDVGNLNELSLAGYESIWLLDPPPLEPAAWRRLDDYARAGGSVVVAMGRGATARAFNAPAPQAMLAGPLKWVSRDESYLRPPRYDHPALSQMADFAEAIVWADYPVFRYWQLDQLHADAEVIAPLANGDPAIIERRVGRGRVVTLTTPLSDFANDQAWNLLPTGQDPWPFLALTRNVADYLSGVGEQQWNYLAGEPAVVPSPPGAVVTNYVLRLPTGEAIKGSQTLGTEIVVAATDQPGNYRLQAGGAQERLDTGFSVNADADIGQLDRIAFSDLEAAFGTERVKLATNRSELSRQVDVGRRGRELYPWLIVCVALTLGAEHLVSNLFYRAT